MWFCYGNSVIWTSDVRCFFHANTAYGVKGPRKKCIESKSTIFCVVGKRSVLESLAVDVANKAIAGTANGRGTAKSHGPAVQYTEYKLSERK